MGQIAEELVDSLNSGILAIDTDYKITVWNKWLSITSGLKPENVKGKNIFDVFPEIRKRSLRKKFDYVFETGRIVQLHSRPDECFFPFQNKSHNFNVYGNNMQQKITLTPIYNNEEKIDGIAIIIEDITDYVKFSNELKKILRELKKSRDFLREVFDGIPNIAVITTDLKGKITFWSKGGENLFGYSDYEVVKKLKIQDIVVIPKNNEQIDFNYYQNILNNKDFHTEELKGIKKDGSEFPVNFCISSGKKEEKNIGTIIVISDISEQKTLQRSLYQAQRMGSIGILAGGIAHDFNNILGGIIGNISLLKLKFKDDEKTYSVLSTMEEISKRAADLTQKLLNFARKGKKTIKQENINLSFVIDEVIAIISKTIDKRIKIIKKYEPDLWTIKGNWAQLEQIIMNLLVNAKDSIKDKGKIEIVCSNVLINENYFEMNPGHYVKVIIKDTGCGISKKNIDRIFEPFFTTKEDGKGTGLGLSMVYGIIKEHNGYIFVESEEGKGTEVTIFLPAMLEPAKIIKKEKVEESYKGTGTILVVDDEEYLRDVIKEMLIKLKYNVLLASNGKEAIEIYKKKSKEIDLVIMDLVMPELNGEEAFYFLKEINPEVKVLFSSGYSTETFGSNSSKGIGFLSKPYSMVDISRKIRDILSL